MSSRDRPFDARRERRCALLLSTALAVGLAQTRAFADPSKLTVGRTTSPPSSRKLSFNEIQAGKVLIELEDYAAGSIDIYPLDSTAATRTANTCTLPVEDSIAVIDLRAGPSPSEACQSLAATLTRGEAIRRAVSRTGSLLYATLEYSPPPEGYEGGLSTAITVDRDKDGNPKWATARIPSYVAPDDRDTSCYLLLGQWQTLPCSGGVVNPSAAQRAAIAAVWGQNKALSLVMKVKTPAPPGAMWRSFSFTLKEKDAPAAPLMNLAPLRERCEAMAKADPSSQSTSFYLVCVDAFLDRRGVVTLECDGSKSDGKRTCNAVGDVVRVLRGFTVHAWHAAGVGADITLGGKAGSDTPLYDGTREKGTMSLDTPAPAPQQPGAPQLTTRTFGPRKAGTAAKLAVNVPAPRVGGDPIKVEQEFTVEAYYRGALRLGFGFTWLPWARTVGLQTTAGGQKYAAVIAGAGQGLFDSEIVAGASYFFCDMPENELKVCAAAGVRFGVLGLSSEVKVASSLMLGPEVAIGRDFAIGLYGGIHQHEYPDAKFLPGKLQQAEVTKIDTHFGLTPAFGLVLNFTPGFLKSVGQSQ